ncbi:MAG: minichromosome maintenance protein MCM [Promethearchaeota archaeon]
MFLEGNTIVIDVNLPPENPEDNFEDFFRNYEDEPNHFKYREAIQNAAISRVNILYILFEDVLLFDPPLAALLRDDPEISLQYAVNSFKDVLRFFSGGQIDESREYFIRVTTKNKSNEVNLRGLRAYHIDKLIHIHGILIRASQIIPQITIATFQCPVCQTQMEIQQIETTQLIPPKVCPNPSCKNKSGFTVVSKDSKFIDWQSIRIQELPEELNPGRVPYSLKGILTHDLVDKVRPGDRVRITGVFKTYPNENKRGKKTTLFTPYIKVLSTEGQSGETDELDISPEELAEIKRYAQTPNVQEIVAKSIVPGILGMEHLKMASALALFGGVRKVLKDGSSRRGDIHILFVGDPGTGKSEILKQCANISPQAIYTSGKGSSAAGLTAAVVRESDMSGLSLEAGALVLADGGNAMIDEFDKMDKKDRVAIHEAMEQQTVSIAKAGIIATLRARTSIIAAANPKMGRYSEFKTPTENINLTPPLLSRFDLIFVVKDAPDEDLDREMADFILNLHSGNSGEEDAMDTKDPLIPIPLLKKYIKYARNISEKNNTPKLTPEAKEVIKEFYINLRKKNNADKNSAIAVVARNLEGYIRLSEAYAKIGLKTVVSRYDAENALKLAQRSLEDTSIDPVTGKLDADRVLTGAPSMKSPIYKFMDELKKKIDNNNGDPVSEKDFLMELEYSMDINREKIDKLLKLLLNEGSIYKPSIGKLDIAKKA